jgi:DNA-binding MarR family transcriptional regulator
MTEQQERIMGIIGERPQCLSDIAREMGKSPATMSYHLKKLADKGLVRGMHGLDLRKIVYVLTDEGKRRVKE